MIEKIVIDKTSNVPAYQQIYLYIKKLIDEGALQPGEEIPSEKELTELFSVSLITVRRSLNDLCQEGYLKKRRGAATTVAHQKTQRDISTFNSFGGFARVRGDNPGSIILNFGTVKAEIHVANSLQIDVGEDVYYLKRIRLLNGRIVGLNETYISKRLGIVLESKDFNSETSLYNLLEKRGIMLGSADETMEARLASPSIKRDLFMENNSPVVYKERTTYDLQGRAVEYSQNTYNGEIYKYYVHIVNVKENS